MFGANNFLDLVKTLLFVTGSQLITCTKIYRAPNNLACDQRENNDKATKQAFTNFFWMGAQYELK
jgi:hypothetical protein